MLKRLDWGTVFYCKYVLDDKGKHFQVEWNRVARIIDEMKGEPRWKRGAFNREKGDNCLNFVHEFVCKLVGKCPKRWPDFMVKMDEEWHMKLPSRKQLFPPKKSVQDLTITLVQTVILVSAVIYYIGPLMTFDK